MKKTTRTAAKPKPKKGNTQNSTTFAKLILNLAHAAGEPLGDESNQEAKEIFVPLEQVDDYAFHARWWCDQVWDCDNNKTNQTKTTVDAKREALGLLGGKHGGTIFHVQCAVLDATVSREDLANRAYALGLAVARLQHRMRERNVVQGTQVMRGQENGGKARSKPDPRWQGFVEGLMKGPSRISWTEACRQVASTSGVNDRTVRNNTVDPRKKIKQKF